mmetsp:Transcript_56071/g.88856  ORF Transcript_56071/g.88856 Transcript_56071/m.88856 type:complete len:697 (+) Transcript_56071:48-2138(+)|eukprot:CAMPEP_0169109318 /NCGR_PEP_ID=MMETSP1015-20121227/25903_1 /TAXON_ID=342587 /ORGANISM="Karlodinium micrum, Strain CCMP2283" /LENGTH=696 /DNA_ID=CAMNT_0009171011 /DNA_START=48 /DNA_END=2138 /DNA_ORIENTATION=+
MKVETLLVLAVSGFGLCRVGANVAVASIGEPGPITKVVELLKTMQKELDAEAKEDKETYEKLKCWCETNNAGKTQAVQDQKQQIDELNALIETNTGKKAELSTEVDQLKKNIAEAKQALAEATEIRKKEAAEFAAEEKELIKSVTLLKGAIVALSKHHTGLLQSDSELMGMRPALRKLVHQNLRRLQFLTVSRDKDALLGFLNANDDILESDAPVRLEEDASLIQMPVFKSYAPQSGQIYGILQQMKEAFEEDLPQIQKEEVAKQQAFALLKGEKESEIKEYEGSIEEKIAQLATTKEDLAAAKSNLKDVKASLSADQQFLLELTERCTQGDYEWERRQKLRSEEIEAVAQAIVILSTDEVRDGQQTTFRSFLQLKMRSPSSLLSNSNNRRDQAVALLNKAAATAPGLVALLASAKSDPFDKVIKAIDELLAKLKLEMADEVKHKDFCVDELHDNQVTTEKRQAQLDNLETELQNLGAKKTKLQDTIATLKKEIAETQMQMQRAAEDRKMENAEFQRVVADQIQTIDALKAAHEKLAAFYFKNSNLLQDGVQATTTVAPSPEFEDYKSNRNSNKVMNMIQKLTGDAKVIKDNAVNDEQNAVNAYVKLVGESNDSIKAKSRAIVDTTGELAETEQAISQATIARDETLRDLESLAATKASLHAQCDFLLKNFALRQQARASEMDALAEVKAILRGMK